MPLPKIYLARHGETIWSLSGQHTGMTDIPLTDHGKADALHLGKRLHGLTFAKVFSSPLQRALKTCELAGFDSMVIPDPLLEEWNYGDYEGLTTTQIQQTQPDWFIFRDGCPGGELPKQVAQRCDQMIEKMKAINGDIWPPKRPKLRRTLEAASQLDQKELFRIVLHFVLKYSRISPLNASTHQFFNLSIFP